MLSKSKRLTKDDFQGKRPKVFFRGTVVDATSLMLPTQKFACVTAKKTFKRAVDRNLIRRRILSCIRELDIKSVTSVIFYPKKGTQTIPYSELSKEIKSVFDTLQ